MGWGDNSGRKAGSLRLRDVSYADWIEHAADIVDEGVLLSIGRSRDGGALSIAFVHNGRKGREWYASDQDFIEGMRDLAVHLGVSSGTTTAPTDPPAHQRARKRG